MKAKLSFSAPNMLGIKAEKPLLVWRENKANRSCFINKKSGKQFETPTHKLRKQRMQNVF